MLSDKGDLRDNVRQGFKPDESTITVGSTLLWRQYTGYLRRTVEPGMTAIIITGDASRNKIQIMPGGGYATEKIEK